MNENENIFDNTLNNSVIDENASNNQQPVAPVQEQPAQEVVQPVQEPAQPVQEVVQPVQEPAQPVQEVVQPVQESVQPVQEPAQPVQEPAQPVQEIVQPVQEVNNAVNQQQQILNQLNNTQSNEQAAQPAVKEPKKKRGGLIIILILIIIGIAGYVIYDKFFADKTDTSTPKDNEQTNKDDTNKSEILEFVSLDLKASLKLEDGNYELIYQLNDEINEKNGTYTKVNDTYTLDIGNKVIVTNEVAEIEDLLSNEFMKDNLILFNVEKIKNVEKNINKSVENHVKEFKNTHVSLAEVEKVETKVTDCFRYAFEGEEINKENITCAISYKVYPKDYDYNVCITEMQHPDPELMKFATYSISSGQCEQEYVSNSSFFSLDQNNNYKTLSTFTGL